MSEYVEILAEDITKENITVYRQLVDDTHYGWHIVANDGYVLYDSASDMPALDMNGNETGEVIKSYSKESYIPVKYNPSTWVWEAVKESEAEYEESV
jgi:hypothetical protein